MSSRRPAASGFACASRCAQQSRPALVGRRPAQAIGEIGREPRQVLHHAGEGPVDKGDLVRPRRSARFFSTRSMPGVSSSRCHSLGRQPAKRGRAARHAPARPTPPFAAPSRGSARGSASVLIEERRHGRGQHGVVALAGDPRLVPAAGDDVRRHMQALRAARAWSARARSRSTAGRDPAARRRAGRRPRRHRAACRCRARARRTCGATRDVVGGIDRRGIELERIDGRDSADRKRRNGHSRTRGTSTVTAKPWPPARLRGCAEQTITPGHPARCVRV